MCSSHPIPTCINVGGVQRNPSSCACGSADCESDGTTGLFCNKKDNRCRKYSLCAKGDGSAVNTAACACGENDCEEDTTGLFCYAPRGFCSLSNKFSQSCVWSTGDGSGGTQKYLGTTISAEKCIEQVQDKQPTANGVSWYRFYGVSASLLVGVQPGQCYAELGMTGPTNEILPSTSDTSNYYITCFLDSIFTSLPVCDHTDGSSQHISSAKCFCGARIIGSGSFGGVCSKNDYCYSPKSICTAIPDPDWVADCAFKTNEAKNTKGCTCGAAVCEPAVNGPYCLQSASRW